jgi:hypothetical protein
VPLLDNVGAGPAKYLLAYREMICLAQRQRRQGNLQADDFSRKDAALDIERTETFAFVNEHGYDGGDPEIVHAKEVSGTTTSPSSFPLIFGSETTEF